MTCLTFLVSSLSSLIAFLALAADCQFQPGRIAEITGENMRNYYILIQVLQTYRDQTHQETTCNWPHKCMHLTNSFSDTE